MQRLVDLRNLLEETALALSDSQFTLDSAQRQAAELQVRQLIARAKTADYSTGAFVAPCAANLSKTRDCLSILDLPQIPMKTYICFSPAPAAQ